MRALLLLPPVSLSPPLVRPRHAPHYTAIAAAALRDAGHEVQVQDAHLHTWDRLSVAASARAADPDVVFLMHDDYNRKIAGATLQLVAEALREALPDRALVLCGRVDAGPAQEALCAVPALDVFLYGEPEHATVAFLAGLDATSPRRPQELGTRSPGSVVRGPTGLVVSGEERVHGAEARRPLDASPFPAWDLVPLRDYAFSPHQQAGDLIHPVLASRGCPFPCFYCEVRSRPRYQARSVESVLAELAWLRSEHGARAVFLADPTFAVDRAWTLDFCARLAALAWPDFRWSCMSRTDRVDDELLVAMAAAGCWNILFGVESLNPEALRGAEKALDPATVGPAIRAARRAGIETIASIMIGLPGDSPASFEQTLDAIIEIGPDFAQFFVLQIDAAQAPAGGRFVSEWRGAKHDFWGRVYAADGFENEAQLHALRRRAFRRFYLRPRYVAGRVQALLAAEEPWKQLARVGRGGLLALKMAAGSRVA